VGRLQRKEEYTQTPKKCPECNSVIPYEKKQNVYCSSECAATHTQQIKGHHQWSVVEKKRLSEWGKRCAYRPPKLGLNKLCEVCGNSFYVPRASKKIGCSRKCTMEWIKKTGYMKGKTGGYRPHSGTSKKGWYKGIFCGSSWELAWVIYHLENNIPFTRNHKGFAYTYSKKIRKYYPDFYLINQDTYIEIKNYLNTEVQAKIDQFPHKLAVLYKQELAPIFDYVTKKYGKDYIRLYEPKKMT
jgi:hypothetical protein